MTISIAEGTLQPGALDDLAPPGSAGNGTDPEGAPEAPNDPNAESLGELLDEKDPKVIVERIVNNLWRGQDARLKPLIAQWDANKLTARGVPGVRAVYDPVNGGWFARVPLTATEATGPSKTQELIEKTTATLLADEPVPDAEPAHDTSTERSAAELATLILKNEMGESGLHLVKRAELASNLAGVQGSAFDVFTVDPRGGGWEPFDVMAHPAAMHYDDANPDAVLRDPTTGLAGESLGAYVRRYVMPDGSLAKGPVGARKRWKMKIKVQRKTGRQVRLLPVTAESIEDAEGVVIADAITFGELCSIVPEVRDLSIEQQNAIVAWRPISLTSILPREAGIVGDGKEVFKSGAKVGYPTDEAIVVTFTVLYRSCASYPYGARVLVAGPQHVLYQDKQSVIVGEGDRAIEECLILPVAQCVAYSDEEGAQPYGHADAEKLGAADEMRQQILSGILDRIWQMNNRNVFVDLSSTLDPGALQMRDGTPLLTDLRAGTPVWETVPPLEGEQVLVYETLGREMNSRSGLEATAQGASSPDVKSGIHAQEVIEQALVALTQRKRNLDSFMLRSWRIVLQLYRAYASTSQLLKYPSEDGSFKVREWKNTDLGSTKDVKVMRGTGTMLTRTSKQNLAQNELAIAMQVGAVDPSVIAPAYQRYVRATTGNLNAMTGMEEDPHRLRVRRQIAAFMEGPPEMEEQAEGPVDALPGDTDDQQQQEMAGVADQQQPPAEGAPLDDVNARMADQMTTGMQA